MGSRLVVGVKAVSTVVLASALPTAWGSVIGVLLGLSLVLVVTVALVAVGVRFARRVHGRVGGLAPSRDTRSDRSRGCPWLP